MRATDCEINNRYLISQFKQRWVEVTLLFVGHSRFVCARKDGAGFGREEIYNIEDISFKNIEK